MELPRYNDQHSHGANAWRTPGRRHWLAECLLWLTDYKGRMERHFHITAVPTRGDLGWCDAPNEREARSAIAAELRYHRGGYKVSPAGPAISHSIGRVSVVLY